ncbi:Myosin-6 (AtMYA2) [Durusdinium trenchii]|uniref:Myosin-6 (AtMYA2) n=1 Tax=Durusdinium trenchii TaxID=1381693 RepID=A0ABP0LFX6_9DINO
MSNQYAQGTLIWVKHDEEVWIQAEIVTSTDKEIIVKTADDPNGRVVLGPNEPIFLRTSDVFTSEGLSVLDDLTQLTHLHEPAVLSSLQNRFDIDKIYTFTGPILIAVNPFKSIPGIYDEEVLSGFISTKPSTKPHVFNTSNASYRGICDRHKSQTVLISGESGAGKTETTKHVMKFLALAGSSDGQVTNVEKQVLESNPLLEAFGNARTLRNDNSSRFGKFIELQFRPGTDSGVKGAVQGMSGESLRLCGARIRHYLLEKVRVCEQQEGERNYHIFYEACAAAAKLGGQKEYSYPQVLSKDQAVEEMVVDLEGFSELSNYAFLTRSTCKTLKDVDDVEMFERRINAMQTIGINKEDLTEVFHMVAAVLNLGNAKFDAPPNNSEGSMVMAECANSVAMAEKLLGIKSGELEKALCNQTRVTRSERIRSPVNVRQAADNRDALAKALYGIVFNFIVYSTNLSIGYIDDVKLFVGVLDIFGFECFKMNSFEQLCINFTNERLQQFFNSFVFKLEEQLYEREGIPWDALDFPDNQDSVDLLAGKGTGVFAMLDEECLVPNGSDQGYCNKLIKQHKGHRRFDEIKTKPTWFVIKHFAGPVSYCTDSFLDKNRDQLSTDLIECVGNSSNQFVANVFRRDPKFADAFVKEEDKAKTKKKKYTVSSEFKDQLSSLMDVVDLTEPHFIRCIKPNPQNVPDLFDRKGVTEQLRYGGVLQVVQVSRAGYPVRINHQECWDDYKVIGASKVVNELRHIQDPKIRAQKLLDHLDTELNIPKPKHGQSWAVGKTLVFFKLPAYERIKFARLELVIKSTTMIQANWRGKVRRRMYIAIRLFTRHVQALLRSKQARADLFQRRSEDSARKIQAHARSKIAKTKYQSIRQKVIKIQAVWHGVLGRRYAKDYETHVSATKLQSLVRKQREQKIYDALKHSIIFAQQRLRMRNAKNQLKKLKQEAKEVGAMMAKAQKAAEQASELRKHNEELEAHQLQLQSENKTLSHKVKQLEEALHQMQQQFEEMKAQAAEAAKFAADETKTVIETEKMEAMNKQMSERDEELAGLRKELQEMKESHAKQQEALKSAEANYQQLLKSTTLQSVGAGAAGTVAPVRSGGSRGHRNVFIQLVGATGTGKTTMLGELIKEHDPPAMQNFEDQRSNLMMHHQIQIGSRALKFLDCSGNDRAGHLVKEWFARTQWVFVIYSLADLRSYEKALTLMAEARQAGANVVLFANKYDVSRGKEGLVNLREAHDKATQLQAYSVEGTSLSEAVRFAASQEEQEPAEGGAGTPADVGDDGQRRSSIATAFDSVKSWFGGPPERGGKVGGVLRPSLKGTKAMKQARREADPNADLRPVQELQDSESAVTCVCFGQERLHRSYILFVTASKDGTVVVYRCYRTEMEIALLSNEDFRGDTSAPPPDHSNIAVHSRLVGHSRAITSVFFNLLEDQLVSTSIDKSVRFWNVDTGEMLKVFTDSSPVPVAAFLPFNPQIFVAANSNAVLRLVNVQNGMVIQKLKVETEVRTLKFDDTGMFLLAGTKSGSIHVLEACDNNTLKFKFKVQLARGGVTCLVFVPAAHGQPPCLLVNTSDSSASIIDCTYGPPAGVLTNLAVRHRVRVAHALLPLKCCYSPSSQGFLISASEDKEVYIYSLAKGANYKMSYLKHHQVPVVAVATNHQDTLLASADSLGRVVLWRRMDFSHIPD